MFILSDRQDKINSKEQGDKAAQQIKSLENLNGNQNIQLAGQREAITKQDQTLKGLDEVSKSQQDAAGSLSIAAGMLKIQSDYQQALLYD